MAPVTGPVGPFVVLSGVLTPAKEDGYSGRFIFFGLDAWAPPTTFRGDRQTTAKYRGPSCRARAMTAEFRPICRGSLGTPIANERLRMLRITQPSESSSALIVEGQLVGPWVDEFRRITFDAGVVAGARLDLRHVSFADAEGIALLRQLRAAGARLEGCSEFLSALIGGGDRAG